MNNSTVNTLDQKTSPNDKEKKETAEISNDPPKPIKPPKPEEKPFEEFIKEELIPGLKEALNEQGYPLVDIFFKEDQRPVTGGNCWMVVGEINSGRRFWLCFEKNIITSRKAVAIAEQGTKPSVLESFLIDEKKTTKALLISRLLQRLNGQKWLGAN